MDLPDPAFPVTFPLGGGGGTFHSFGMSLRDYFAGQAVLGCTSNPTFVMRINAETGDDAEAGRAIMASAAYAIADALLAARKETPTT